MTISAKTCVCVMCDRRYTYRNFGPTGVVDPVHVFAELRAVTVSVSVVLGHKQQRVNHFMKESLWKQKIIIKS